MVAGRLAAADADGPGSVAAPPAPSTLVEASGLRYSYGYRRVVDGVDFALASGEIVALFGPNGAGKSTLVRLLCGLLPPEAGSVRWWGRPLAEMPEARRHMAFVGHASQVFPELSARENLIYYGRLLGLDRPEARAEEALRGEGLGLFADSRVATFSRGMLQRLSLCRAWLGDPRLVFADEPATGLDPDAAGRLATALGGVRARGGGVVLVAHDLPGALDLADRYLVLAGGRVAAAGDAAPWRSRGEAFTELYRRAVSSARAAARAGCAADGSAVRPPIFPAAARTPASAPAPAPPPGRTPHGRVLAAVFARELWLWWRGQERLGTLLANGLLMALVFGFAFDPQAVNLSGVFAGILWISLLFTGLPALGRGFALEWETGAVEGFLACGAEPAVLFYGKCLANLAGFLLAEAALVPVFLALLQVAPGPLALEALLALLLGSAGFVAAGTLAAAVVGRAVREGGQALLALIGLPMLSPIIFGTARLAQGFLDRAPEMPGVWFLLLGAYAILFWSLPALVFPIIAGV